MRGRRQRGSPGKNINRRMVILRLGGPRRIGASQPSFHRRSGSGVTRRASSPDGLVRRRRDRRPPPGFQWAGRQDEPGWPKGRRSPAKRGKRSIPQQKVLRPQWPPPRSRLLTKLAQVRVLLGDPNDQAANTLDTRVNVSGRGSSLEGRGRNVRGFGPHGEEFKQHSIARGPPC